MNHRAEQHPVMDWINRHISVLAFLGLAAAIAFTLVVNNHNQDADAKARAHQIQVDNIARCVAAIDTRNVQRQTVEAIFQLAVGVVARDPSAAPLTEQQIEKYNAYVKRANDFRDNTYKMIKPSKPCAPYVDDGDVKPPTPPAPLIKAVKKG